MNKKSIKTVNDNLIHFATNRLELYKFTDKLKQDGNKIVSVNLLELKDPEKDGFYYEIEIIKNLLSETI